MDQHTRIPASPAALEALVSEALQHLEGLGYSRIYLRRTRSMWQAFLRFVQHEQPAEPLSQQTVTRFLVSRGLPRDAKAACLSAHQRHLRAVMRILSEFALHGCYQRRRHITQQLVLPAASSAVLHDYLAFCTTNLKCRHGTIRIRQRHLTQFLHFLAAHQLPAIAELRAPQVAAFVTSQVHLQPASLALLVSNLRSFLRYLHQSGHLATDLSGVLPTIQIRRDARIPPVWRREDVAALLAAVDRSSPKGKRDYAILLLACRLGLRVSDIRGLRLDQLRWDEARIEFPQVKTGHPLSLPLSDEVGSAVIDYLRHGRPATAHREVFLRATPPLEPFGHDDNLYHLITFYRRRAGIALPTLGRRG